MMKRIAWIFAYMIVGAAAFWTPDILLHARRNENPVIRTIVLPSTLFVLYWLFCHFRRQEIGSPSLAIFMILGVWFLGPTAMMVGASFYGGGFVGRHDIWVVILMGFLPFYTFIMATYDASLLGLLIASAAMVTAHFKFEPKHWAILPQLRAWLTRGYRINKSE